MVTAYVGEIRPFAGGQAPDGWALCDGSSVSSASYPVLAALLGASVRNGRIQLPDLRGRVPLHRGQGTANGATDHPFGSAGGREQVVLASNEVPAHTHMVRASTSDGDAASPAGAVLARPRSRDTNLIRADLYFPGDHAQTAGLHASAISVAGGSQSHDNCMPSLAIAYIICLAGDDPRN